MADKQEGVDYIHQALDEFGCEQFRFLKHGNEIRCGCPYHSPKSSTAFKVTFPKDREPFFHCHVCKENGDLPSLISYLHKVSYKKAVKRLLNKTTLGKVSIDQISEVLDRICNAFEHSGFVKQHIDALPEKSYNQEPMYEYLEYRRKKSHYLMDIEWIVRKYNLYYCGKGDWKGRIIMPINIGGKQISFNDRSVYHEAKLKSMHPTGGHFEDYIHGLDESKGKKNVIVVEGAFDMFQVMSFLKEYELLEDFGCVCLMNADVTDTKASLIAGAFDKALLLFDGDKAGREGTARAITRLEDLMEVEDRTQFLKEGLDPGKALPSVLEKVLFKKQIKKKNYMDSIWGI